MGLFSEQAANIQGQEKLSGSGGKLWLRRLGDVEKVAQAWRLLRSRPKPQTQISKLLFRTFPHGCEGRSPTFPQKPWTEPWADRKSVV